ncbi:hypothetical protein HPB51_024245 [Rhipicephalus microplus]|uniref:Uncharacterized protein n=1 Tax=Rhipicephalus microplus TaxID=6941 RepID=A0A9J6DXX8_RHIMP|nr:hypothetical protein HPB51_024245 [Rhipicephalus microplus]
MKGKDPIFRGAYNRTTESWMFGYKGHAAVITGPRPRDRLRRRESFRYESLDPNDLPSDEKPGKQGLRRAHRTALCLLVACFVLMVIMVLLVIAALWLRGRYRSQGTALYSTLEVSDPDLPAYLPANRPVYLPPSPQPTDDDLPSRMEKENDELPRKLAGQSISEPVMWTSKVADDSPVGVGKVDPSVTTASPERIICLHQMQSAPANRVGHQFPSSANDYTALTDEDNKALAHSWLGYDHNFHGALFIVRATRSVEKSALAVAPLPQSSSADSFESLAITKHNERPAAEADCCNQVMSTTLLFPLLALCKRSKPVDFLQVLHEDGQATKLSWDEPGSGDVFHVQRSQRDGMCVCFGSASRISRGMHHASEYPES